MNNINSCTGDALIQQQLLERLANNSRHYTGTYNLRSYKNELIFHLR